MPTLDGMHESHVLSCVLAAGMEHRRAGRRAHGLSRVLRHVVSRTAPTLLPLRQDLETMPLQRRGALQPASDLRQLRSPAGPHSKLLQLCVLGHRKSYRHLSVYLCKQRLLEQAMVSCQNMS